MPDRNPDTSLLDEFKLAGLIKTSSLRRDPDAGSQLHAKSIRAGLASDPGVRTSLISMYSTFGLLDSSRQVFDEMPPAIEADVPTWNSIIAAYASHCRYAECFLLFFVMVSVAHLNPSEATYVIMLGACSSRKDITMGQVLHARIIKPGIAKETKLLNCLITLYSKCGELRNAYKAFEVSDVMNIVSWNAMIAGLEHNEECEQALRLFRRLTKKVFVKPNRITLLSVLSAIAAVSALKLGGEVHARIIRLGLDCEISIGNSLITMYGKCGEVVQARTVFKRLPYQDVVTWNSMLASYAQNQKLDNGCELFQKMQSLGIKPDDHTLTILLGGLSSDRFVSSSCKLGREIHGYLLRRSALRAVQVSAYNAVVTMYAKSNRVGDAEKLFGGMAQRDSYSWNAMIDGYSMNGFCMDAIGLFVELFEQGLQYDHLTFSILLTACSRLVSIELGKQFHALAVKQLHLCNSESSLLSVFNALVTMYSKCGSIDDASKVFQRMARRDVFSWTAMITGYAHHGMAYESLHLFKMMRGQNVMPNSITFLSLLTACTHAGLVEEGAQCFSLMSKENREKPSIEHYACMVDLFGRSGQFKRAEAMVEAAISHLGHNPDSSLCLWKVLLGSCHSHKKLDLGVQVAARIFELHPEDETTHVLLSNLYASFGLWKDATAVRRRMRDRGLKKEAGCSWVEAGNRRHVFVAGDVCHPDRKEIYEKVEELDERCRKIGYSPMTELVLHDIDELQKEVILSCHSEKLAVSFAILRKSTRRGVIRVIKNLRVCEDCHNWMKFASQVEGREIVLRDSRRFHSFKYGRCSCGDYW